MKSATTVVTGQTPVTLEWEDTSGKTRCNPKRCTRNVTAEASHASAVLALTRITKSAVTGQAPLTQAWRNTQEKKKIMLQTSVIYVAGASRTPACLYEQAKMMLIHMYQR